MTGIALPSRVHRHTPIPDSPPEACDSALALLNRRKKDWVTLSATRKAQILGQLRLSFADVADRWAQAEMKYQGLDPEKPASGEKWIAGPYIVLRSLRYLESSLRDIARNGAPTIPGKVREVEGRVKAEVVPTDHWDRTFYPGVTAEVWMQEGVTAENLSNHQAEFYRDPHAGKIALVLGAGNVSSIGPLDALYKLFVDGEVVLYKTHPVNDYLGPFLAEGFRPLVEAGFLRVVYGGGATGAYLVHHPQVDTLHITGSHHTVEAIVYGPGEEGRHRLMEDRRLVTKPLTSELGNVSPLIVMPGEWSERDIAFQAENIATSLANNAGFNCNATRVIIMHREWPQAEALLTAIREVWHEFPTRLAYYPGAKDRFDDFLADHPEAEVLGEPKEGELPWTLVTNLSPDAQTRCYTEESFCALSAQTWISAGSTSEFLEKAVLFANESLWGTLSATLIVDPVTKVEFSRDLNQAIADLRYGTVSINHWAAIGFALGVTPWGAYPGHTLQDLQSGQGVVHNTLMFSKVEKTVVRAPFRPFPKPPWFVSHRTSHKLAEKLVRFEASPSALRLPGIFATALQG